MSIWIGALTIRFERMLRDGEVRDQSELARLAHVTQPRMTQILNLLHLAPSIQEEILHLPLVTEGKDPIHEKMLRPIAAEVDWARQREMWAEVRVRGTNLVSQFRRRGSTPKGVKVSTENPPRSLTSRGICLMAKGRKLN